MQCPRCKNRLLEVEYEGLQVFQCPTCKGHWVPGQRLSQIVDIRQKTFTPEEMAVFERLHKSARELVHQADSTAICPECEKQMLQNRYPYAAEVLIDRCPDGHGIWLDAGELDHVQMAVEWQQDEMRLLAQEKQLKIDTSFSEKLLLEQDMYRYNFRKAWLWLFF